MNKFAVIFDTTQKFLQTKGVTPEIVRGSKASQSDLRKFQKQTKIVLPESFSTFYTDFANGFGFSWGKSETFGQFTLPTLELLADGRHAWEKNVKDFADDPHSMDNCVEAEFRSKAFQIWHGMKSWVPLWYEGNGDHFCLNTTNEHIVYDQHDWFDGFGSLAKTNGILAGKNLYEFVENWSRFCFMSNKSLWWGEFGKDGFIRWEPKFFDRKFFRKQ